MSVDSGTNPSFAIAANDSYQIADVLVDGVSVGPVSSYQFTHVTAGHAISAFFALVADQGYHVAYGSVFTVNASDLGKTSFDKKPKVMVNHGGKAKVLGFQKGSATATCVWMGKDKPDAYTLLVNGETLTEEFVVEPPSDIALTPGAGKTGDKIAVTGSFFSSKCPKVTLEFKDAKGKLKKASCKVLKPYKYDDANGKAGKSVMYVGEEASTEGYQPGDSELTFIVPKGITESTTAKLKLNCDGTIVERQLNATK